MTNDGNFAAPDCPQKLRKMRVILRICSQSAANQLMVLDLATSLGALKLDQLKRQMATTMSSSRSLVQFLEHRDMVVAWIGPSDPMTKMGGWRCTYGWNGEFCVRIRCSSFKHAYLEWPR